MTVYQKVTSWEEALNALTQPEITILAGGTDLYADERFPHKNSRLVDISQLKSNRLIVEDEGGWWLDALMTWSDVNAANLPPIFDGLKTAARQIGGVQIQNAGTIGGNISNASPAADSVPPLMTLNAEVEIRNLDGTRLVPLGDFILGRRKTILGSGEMISRIFVPKPDGYGVSDFIKIGGRAYLVISPVMVAGMFDLSETKTINSCRIVVGACSEVAQKMDSISNRLVGLHVSDITRFELTSDDFAGLTPISDGRASAEYRLQSAKTLVARLLKKWGALYG